jgi:hypothetical protein
VSFTRDGQPEGTPETDTVAANARAVFSTGRQTALPNGTYVMTITNTSNGQTLLTASVQRNC